MRPLAGVEIHVLWRPEYPHIRAHVTDRTELHPIAD
jgi:hypothetical protein